MNRTAVEQIKERIPIEELIGSYLKLKKAGKSFKARCPFHNEKTPSFFVSPERGGYYCFGCGAKGDIFSFVEQFEGLDFRGALKVLAERAGVKIEQDTKADGERDNLFQIMEDAARYFEGELGDEGGAKAREYLKSRGITDATRQSFRIGWAPIGWRNLYSHLKEKGYSLGMIERAGLAKKGEDGLKEAYDRFRGRIMFPISDSSGRVIAFSGRILEDDGKSAKYLNSPDTPLYDKSLVLYGLDKAKSEIRRMGYAILVEGQMDLVMSHQSGIRNAVAASGTALTDEATAETGAVSNLGLVRRLSPNVIIAFDSDSAGKKAALRAAGIALSMGMDVKIAAIEGGKDPADLVREDPELWKNALRKAKQVVEFELDNVLNESPNERKLSKMLQERVYPLVLRVPSRSDREYFVKLIRDRANMSREDVIWEDLRVLALRLEKESGVKTAGSSGSSGSSGSAGSRTSGEMGSRIDLVGRRLFGLLKVMESAKHPKAHEYAEEAKKIAGDSFEKIKSRMDAVIDDAIFEAEALFGDDPNRFDEHVRELLLNFESDLIGEEITSAMARIRVAEKSGDQALVAELAKKCQALSLRKSQINANIRHL